MMIKTNIEQKPHTRLMDLSIEVEHEQSIELTMNSNEIEDLAEELCQLVEELGRQPTLNTEQKANITVSLGEAVSGLMNWTRRGEQDKDK